jgi:hypothetical protein
MRTCARDDLGFPLNPSHCLFCRALSLHLNSLEVSKVLGPGGIASRPSTCGDAEEYSGEADSRGMDSRGFNK